MKTNVKVEQPIYTVYTTYDENSLFLYVKDLKRANVGKKWIVEDQDCYPNASQFWDVTVTVVYKNDKGVALLKQTNNADDTELTWVELH